MRTGNDCRRGHRARAPHQRRISHGRWPGREVWSGGQEPSRRPPAAGRRPPASRHDAIVSAERKPVIPLAGIDAPAVRGRRSDPTPFALGRSAADTKRAARGPARGRRTLHRQIAQLLFVTVKAVDYHLANTYRKPGIRALTTLRLGVCAAQGVSDGGRESIARGRTVRRWPMRKPRLDEREGATVRSDGVPAVVSPQAQPTRVASVDGGRIQAVGAAAGSETIRVWTMPSPDTAEPPKPTTSTG